MKSAHQPAGGAILVLGGQAADTVREGPRIESETVVGIIRTELENRDPEDKGECCPVGPPERCL